MFYITEVKGLMTKNISVLRTGTGCPERLWSLHP